VTSQDPANADGELDGTVEGVSRTGALRLRVGAALHLVSSGEVSVRIVDSLAGGAV
jgi:hypothetical protein